MAINQLLGLGVYSVPEAARILKVHPSTLGRWAKGYTFGRREARRFSEPVIARQLQPEESEDILTFVDLVELRSVAYFRSEGVSMQMVRRCAENASELFGTDHPFAAGAFETDGSRIYAVMEAAGPGTMQRSRFINDLDRWQLVFDDMVVPFFRNLEIEDDLAARYWPLGRRKPIVLDPRRAFGKPIDADSGVQTYILHEAHQAGQSEDEVAYWYDVSPTAVQAAVEFEEWLAA